MDFVGSRHNVIISNPVVKDRKMTVMLNIKDWDEFHCFLYPVDRIDCKIVMTHVLWKLAVDPWVVIKDVCVVLDLEQRDWKLLELREWKFI